MSWFSDFADKTINAPDVRLISTTSDFDIAYDNNVTIRASGFSIGEITEAVKKSLGYLEKPLVKCKHCGQWGAAYCACKHCGAPIDPE